LDNSNLVEDGIADNKKFDILVEALWEVVKDYIDKWDKEDENSYGDSDYGWDDNY
jgi:hypothetical protein